MKKTFITLLALLSTCHVLAADCKHAEIPKMKGKNVFEFKDTIRPKLIANGWKPDIDPTGKDDVLYQPDLPEAKCAAPQCFLSYIDKRGNGLSVGLGDFVFQVRLDCK